MDIRSRTFDQTGNNFESTSRERNLRIRRFGRNAASGDRIREDADRHVHEESYELPPLSEDEVESALGKVHDRLGFRKDERPKGSSSDDLSIKYRSFLVAASLLIALFTGWALMPITYSVPAGERTSFQLPDGTTVELNSGTSLQYNRLFNYTQRRLRLNGEAYFRVEPGSHPFRVHANGTVTEVTGTEFNLRSWASDHDSRTTLSVRYGTVRFYPEQDPSTEVLLETSYYSSWGHSDDAPATPDTASIERFTSWQKNHLSFSEQSLSVIFGEIERRFDIRIELDDASIGRERLTTYYTDPVSAESILTDISTVKGLEFTRTSEGYHISHRENGPEL